MVGSYLAPAGTQDVVAIAGYVDLINTTPALENWWKFGTGNCRPGAFSASTDFTGGPFTCIDFFQGQATTLSNSAIDGAGRGPNTVRLRVLAAIVTGDTLMTGQEYYGFKMNISNTLSTGAGACSGCLTPTCIVLNEITVEQPAVFNQDFVLTGAPVGGRDYITWQGSSAIASCATVPVRNRTWGQIKGMYR